MKSEIYYYTGTDKIISVVTCPSSRSLIPEGPVEGDPTISVKHGTACPINDRIEHGKVVPQGLQQRRKREIGEAWSRIRRERTTLLNVTQHKVSGDFPISKNGLRRLKRLRQKLRDITEVPNPKEARAELNRIREAIDGLE